MELISPAEGPPGDKVAVLSPSFAAPAVAPAVHEQALERLRAITGLVPVEYPTTRRLGASAAGPGGRPQRGVRRPRDPGGARDRSAATTRSPSSRTSTPTSSRADPKPFLGYSDNTNLLNWLWTNGVAGFYGGSTQVQLGPGPARRPDPRALAAGGAADGRAPRDHRARRVGGLRPRLERPARADRVRRPRADRALGLVGSGAVGHRPHLGRLHRGRAVDPDRRPVPGRPGRARRRRAAPGVLGGPHPRPRVRLDRQVARRARAPGGGGRRRRRAASDLRLRTSAVSRRSGGRSGPSSATWRSRSSAATTPRPSWSSAPPFGHTRPQWIVPYGGLMTVDGASQRLFADYG